MDKIIASSLEELKNRVNLKKIQFNNEIGLQIELIIILRGILGENFYVFPEKNIVEFGFDKEGFLKKEIDILVVDKQTELKYAIELKYPTQGQYPEQMFKVCCDIAFLEQLKDKGFAENFFIMFAKDSNFYGDKGGGPIYDIFRKKKKLSGLVVKPTGAKDKEVEIKGEYAIKWCPIQNSMQYFKIVV